MTSHQSLVQPGSLSTASWRGPLVQRTCACGGSCAKCGGRDEDSDSASKTPGIALQPLHKPVAVSRPDDRFEREAEQTADAVMRMPASDTPVERDGGDGVERPAVVQRQLEGPEGEEDEEDQEEPKGRNEAEVAPKAGDAAPVGSAAQRQSVLANALDRRSSGAALEAPSRQFMEDRFAFDFSRVRIHSDDRAHAAAEAIGARAFTSGSHIWFRHGEFSPQTNRGRHLLAHELTHTIQQGGRREGVSRLVQRSTCPASCVDPVSNGSVCRAPKKNRDCFGETAAADDSNKISHIRVVLGDRKVTLFWNGRPETAEGTPEEFPCTPNDSETPKRADKVGIKCGPDYTNLKRYNMAWFTAFKSTDRTIGFHDSQPVGAGFQSHGCVRVSCENAEKINKNSSSGWTSIRVR